MDDTTPRDDQGSESAMAELQALEEAAKMSARLPIGADIIPLSIRRPAKANNITMLRQLDDCDILRLQGPRGIMPPPLKTLRGVHHRIAKLLAEGLRESDVAYATNMSVSRISILKSDPAFKELIAHYADQVAEAHKDFVGNLADLRDTAVQTLHERLLDTPDEVSTASLIEIVKSGADRTGHGPQGKMQVTGAIGVLTSAEMEALKMQLAGESSTKVVDVSTRTLDAESTAISSPTDPVEP